MVGAERQPAAARASATGPVPPEATTGDAVIVAMIDAGKSDVL